MKRKLLLIAGVLLLVLISYWTHFFDSYWNSVYDAFYQNPQETDPDIVIVAIDDASINMLGQWPFDREIHADVINYLSQGNPAVIGIDLMFDSYSNAESDKALTEAVKDAGNVVLAKQIVYTPKINGYKQGSDTLISQFSELLDISTQGHINTYADSDRVIRKINMFGNRFVLENESYEYEPNFSYQIMKQYVANADIPDEKKTFLEGVLKKYDNYTEPLYIDYKGKPRQYDNIPYFMLYNEMIPAKLI